MYTTKTENYLCYCLDKTTFTFWKYHNGDFSPAQYQTEIC